MARSWLKILIRWRKYLVLLLTPILLSPLPIAIPDKRSRCAYAIIIMAVYWTTETCSLAVTSLLPLLLFPILGVVSAKEISPPYFSDTNILFIGGMMVAIAVEQWNLHKRIALKILLLIGTQPRRLLLGFMCPTFFLSMWVSNTATTAMMVPIAQAVLGELKEINKPGVGEENEKNDSTLEENVESVEMGTINKDSSTTKSMETQGTASCQQKKDELDYDNLCKATVLSIAYAANIGGTSTLTGTGTNLVFVGQMEELFKESGGVGFGQWFVFAFPEALLLLFLSWLWLQWVYIGFNFRDMFRLRNRSVPITRKEGSSARTVIQRQYDTLGPITFAEKAVLVHFTILALLWIVRDPKFIPGWSAIFKKGYVRDATASIAVAFSMFNFPAKKPKFFDFDENEDGCEDRPFPTLLEWKVVTKKFPWNIVFLLGGAFAMAKAAKDSGLSEWIGEQLGTLESIPQFCMVLILSLILCMFTEVTSNVATASIFLPIFGALATNIHIHPWYFMVPATLSCSFAYMLPVATPPNAIVFSSGYLKVFDMVKTGIIMNIMALTVLLMWLYSFGKWWFKLDTFPAWAKHVNATMNATKCA